MGEIMNSEFDNLIRKYISPTLTVYTGWVVSEAERLGIKHLFFLARDGYQMYHIAKQKYSSIECSYFYCSRYALRMAAYRFLDDSAYNKLFIPSFRLTAANMLKRADLDKDERMLIYDEIGFSGDENAVMGRKEFTLFCERVRNSVIFNDILKSRSDLAYSFIVEYIRQEGMADLDSIGIVDLGWTGSLQHTLRRLLDSMGVKAELHGFYMGMLTRPPEVSSNEYHTWLFSEKNADIIAWFSHNLIECICSAPHGMTIGYTKHEGKVVPVMADNENDTSVAERIKSITLSYDLKNKKVYDPQYRVIALNLLHKLMFSPSVSETETLKGYNFCDDVGEQYHRGIVQDIRNIELVKEILPFKLFCIDSADGLYWYYGTLAASSAPCKSLWKYGYYLTRCLISLIRQG